MVADAWSVDSWRDGSVDARIALLEEVLAKRAGLCAGILGSLDERLLALRNQVLEVQDWPSGVAWVDRQRAVIYRACDELERDRRRELVAYWKDTLDLRRELQDLRLEAVRTQMLEGSDELRPEPKEPDPASKPGEKGVEEGILVLEERLP